MDSLKFDTGVKRLAINDDPNNLLVFNPADVGFAERFYAVYREFRGKQAEYERRAKDLDERKDALDADGAPTALPEGLAFLREVCEFMYGRIDYVFSEGSSRRLFGDSLSIEAIGAFMEAVQPFIQQARSEKVTKYLNQELAGKVMK